MVLFGKVFFDIVKLVENLKMIEDVVVKVCLVVVCGIYIKYVFIVLMFGLSVIFDLMIF